MSFGQAVKSVFSKYATFNGRARRSEYWWWYLFSVLVLLPFGIIFGVTYVITLASIIDATDYDGYVDSSQINWAPVVIGIAIYAIPVLALLLPSIAVLVRRLHDMGQSGWWVLLGFVGLGIVPVIMAFFDSEVGDNQHGPDPKAGERMPVGGAYPAQSYPAQAYAAQPPQAYAAQGYAAPPVQGVPPVESTTPPTPPAPPTTAPTAPPQAPTAPPEGPTAPPASPDAPPAAPPAPPTPPSS